MKLIKSKKALALLGILVVAAAAAIGAYAYFTSSGSGTGTATVGTSTAFVLHGTSASTLYPGTSSVVTFTVDNPGSGNQKLGTIHLAGIAACSVAWSNSNTCNGGAAGVGDIAGCGSIDDGSVADAATHDFYMADVAVNHDYAPGSGQAVTPTGTLKMNDLSSSQDACKNANLLLNLTAAAPAS
jgi:hypothetical protein